MAQQSLGDQVQHRLNLRVLAVSGQAEEGESNLVSRGLGLFQNRAHAFLQHQMQAFDADLDMIAGAAFVARAFAAVAVHQHEGCLGAPAVDAEIVSARPVHAP